MGMVSRRVCAGLTERRIATEAHSISYVHLWRKPDLFQTASSGPTPDLRVTAKMRQNSPFLEVHSDPVVFLFRFK